MSDTTRLLRAWRAGDDQAFSELYARVYDELKSIAHLRMSSAVAGAQLSTTVLVHETYMKLAGGAGVEASDRAHFLAVVSRAMRFVLVDRARANTRQKRGGGRAVIDLDAVQVAAPGGASEEFITLNDALERLATFDERLARVVECRFFGGMEYEEIAEATGLSVPTVKRDWARARSWLYAFMRDEAPSA